LKVSIVGCGIAGLASAIRMAVKGHQVSVYEKSNGPGGKLSQFEETGYRFDVGPSIFTMPHFVDELFYLAGKNPRDYFNYKKMETACHYFWEDGTKFNAYSDIDRLEEEATSKLGVPAGVIKDYMAYNKRKYDSTGRIFLEKSLHKSSNLVK
jgi:phytoene dehydrogenase-like protein